MFTPRAAVRAYLCLDPVDMRLSFDRLAALAREVVGLDPGGGHLFLFHARRHDRLKILYWDEDGYALWYKRLEAGTFRIPFATDTRHVTLTPAEMTLLLAGVDLTATRKRRRWHGPARAAE
jgi:transposase